MIKESVLAGTSSALALAVRRYILIGISESDNQIKMAKYVWLILLYAATRKIWMSSIIFSITNCLSYMSTIKSFYSDRMIITCL